MNIFNKIIVILILVSIIGLSAIFMLGVFIGYFNLASRIIDPGYHVSGPVGFLASLAVFAIAIFLMVMEFYRRRPKVANISSSESGNAMVTLDTVSKQVRTEALKIDGLSEVKVKVIPKSAGVIINMNAWLKENMDVPAKMQEIIDKSSSMVSDKLGVKVIKTNLTIVELIPRKEGVVKRTEESAGESETKSEFEVSEETDDGKETDKD